MIIFYIFYFKFRLDKIIMHKYIDLKLDTFFPLTRKETDIVFFQIEKKTQNLLNNLRKEDILKEIKRFENLKSGAFFQKNEISIANAKNRLRRGIMAWILHIRYFCLLLDPRHGEIIIQRLINRFVVNTEVVNCPICLSESKTTVRLFCGEGKHSFCGECLKKWIFKQIQQYYGDGTKFLGNFCPTCPLCRSSII